MTDLSLTFERHTRSISGESDWFNSARKSNIDPYLDIFQLLLSWVDNWPLSKLTLASHSLQFPLSPDEIALTIWTMQTYKRYQQRLTGGAVGASTLYVPPHLAKEMRQSIVMGNGEKARMVLEYLWHGIGQRSGVVPKRILVLCQDWNDTSGSGWIVLQYVFPSPPPSIRIHRMKYGITTDWAWL